MENHDRLGPATDRHSGLTRWDTAEDRHAEYLAGRLTYCKLDVLPRYISPLGHAAACRFPENAIAVEP